MFGAFIPVLYPHALQKSLKTFWDATFGIPVFFLLQSELPGNGRSYVGLNIYDIFYRGDIAEKEGRLDDAIQVYRDILRQIPEFGQARGRLGLVLLRAGRPVEALIELDLAGRQGVAKRDVETILNAARQARALIEKEK